MNKTNISAEPMLPRLKLGEVFWMLTWDCHLRHVDQALIQVPERLSWSRLLPRNRRMRHAEVDSTATDEPLDVGRFEQVSDNDPNTHLAQAYARSSSDLPKSRRSC